MTIRKPRDVRSLFAAALILLLACSGLAFAQEAETQDQEVPEVQGVPSEVFDSQDASTVAAETVKALMEALTGLGEDMMGGAASAQQQELERALANSVEMVDNLKEQVTKLQTELAQRVEELGQREIELEETKYENWDDLKAQADKLSEKARKDLQDAFDILRNSPVSSELTTAMKGFIDFYGDHATRIIRLENQDVAAVAEVLSVYSGVQIQVSPELDIITVSGPAVLVEAVEKTVADLDQPDPREVTPPNVELTAYIIEAGEDTGETKVPAELEDVVAELEKVFSFQYYTLSDILMLRCRSGEQAEISSMKPMGEDLTGTYKFMVNRVEVEKSGGQNIVHLDDVVFGADVPFVSGTQQSGRTNQPQAFTRVERREMGLRADVDAREGQKVVVGKANILGEQRGAMFFVITAKVIETGEADSDASDPDVKIPASF